MESNVTLKSNIYINKTASTGDHDFLSHITDYQVLRRYGNAGNSWRGAGWMTPTQRAILEHGQPNCSLERGTMSWGVPVGSDRFVCRCEQYTCPMFNNTCSKYLNFESVDREEIDHPTVSPVVINVKTHPLNDKPAPTIETIVPDPKTPFIPVDSGKKQEDSGKAGEPFEEPVVVSAVNNAVQVTEQSTIINAPISERIWVNAGPGTGKTYTVIQRLKKLLNTNPEGTILVLCFSKNAVQVIHDRLQEAIGHQTDNLISDGQLVIRTFDSFATYMLEDELNPTWDYNRRILDRIRECIVRLYDGITALQSNDTAWRAFCLMNKAMMRQSAKKRRQPEKEVSWYPFQLCYVLMCIPDMADSSSKWRDTVDLLWFPTGGGKTEAYLGVAAFTIFYRRLTKGEAGRGVTVLMRYTLRMLTAQQFERAAALICECELIRRQEKLPGGEISIGLWVGGEVTPNHVTADREDLESAESILEKLKNGLVDEVRSSPVQLTACPYCGTALRADNAYEIRNNQFLTHCPNERCAFHDDLPVMTVDDDVYARKPTLLIGTIDKFARLAWEEKTGSIFAEDGIGLPPELLIQDELHLISGPLGSISGLYEIAIEKLCMFNGVKPKILASTATLCNAEQQIRALYGKPAFQFPPSGFDANDSFFAKEASPQERPQRMYIGFCETGGSLPDALVRVFGTVKFALQYMIRKGANPAIIDQFWTNVGYFNSLKDLGSADTLIIDRVCSYAESLRRHKFKEWAEEVDMKPLSNEYEYGELTSRKSAREIAEVRNQLDRQHYPSPGALNYVLSSNMLSVGIDINRLGLMTVYGQPKLTAEYIQATSRVGRSNPGLVIVLLHMLRTRDKSHYEQFQRYHQTLNKMVEPTSAAPYACRAMDKALHAVFITLVRHCCPTMRSNRDAAKFRNDNPRIKQLYDEVINIIDKRSKETAEYAKGILEEFIDMWQEAATNRGVHFQYQLMNKSEDDTDALLIPAERSENAAFPPTMNSMRNVDTQSGVFLKRRR